MSDSIPRPDLLQRILLHRGTPDIKVITGVRRCGKSTALSMLRDTLVKDGTPERNIFYKRFDAFDLPLDYTVNDLHQELIDAAAAAEDACPFIVMLDEIQDIPGWEKVVRRLHTRERTDVYITGSNANLLSSDLATYLTGRYVEIPAFPLSLREYIDFADAYGALTVNPSADDLLGEYLLYGGMPGMFALRTRNAATISDELRDIYQSILFKDVAQRYGIRDLDGLEKLSRFLFATSGSLFSTRNVVNTLTSAGHKTTAASISNQVNALKQAFLIYQAEQEGIQGRTVLRPLNKYYPVDNGFRGLANGFSPRDVGARLEGVIYMELIRRGYTVGIGAGEKTEIDFVAKRMGAQGPERLYVQVTASLLDESTRAREFASLLALHDAFPRLVITLDPYSTGVTDEGIRVVRAVDWLLRNE